jgi:hypothetical protein
MAGRGPGGGSLVLRVLGRTPLPAHGHARASLTWKVCGRSRSAEDVGAQGAWLATQRERFQELHQQLLAEGWRPAGRGVNWWSAVYRRPDLAWDTPPDAYNRTQRSA